jgi:hypothetical protein
MSVKCLANGHRIVFNREPDGVLYYLQAHRSTTNKDIAMFLNVSSSRTPAATGTTSDEAYGTALLQPTSKFSTLDINTAHDIYGHVSEQALRDTFKSINTQLTGTLRTCEGCSLAKAKAKKVSKLSTTKSTVAGERIFVDISGPYKKSIVGSDYWVLVVDEHTGKSWSFFTKKKSNLSVIIDNFLIKLKAADFKVRFLRCDNAGENLRALVSVCDSHGVTIEYTAPNTPQYNGVVERKFVTITSPLL